MLQLPIEELDAAPGHFVTWTMRPAGAQTPAPTAEGQPGGVASYNQEKHFSTAQEAQRTDESVATWLAVTFELPGVLDRKALEAALLHFVRRHEVLRCAFQQLAGDLTCDTLDPDAVVLDQTDVGYFASAGELRSCLHRFFRQIDTLAGPLFVMGAVVGDASSTVYLAFDHIVYDGMSAPVAVQDIATAYAAYERGEEPGLPEAGSYLAFSRTQRERNEALDADDSRLDHWKGFMERNGGFFPPFPLDLGLEQGRMYPAVNETDLLLAGEDAEALEARCRADGGNLFLASLAAVGVSLRAEGGPDVYRGIVPVSERGRGPYTRSLGWFVNPMPVEFALDAGDFAGTLANVRTAATTMMRHAGVPFVKAWQLLAPEYAAISSWPYAVNLFSYVDTRDAPGGESEAGWNARGHTWVPQSNGLCLLFNRDTTGLYVNTLYADTPQARRTKAALSRTLTLTMENMAHAGTF